MNENKQYNYKSRLEEIVPSTRFGQGLATLFFLKRHKKKRDDHGRAPVVSRLRAQSTLQLTSASSSNFNTVPTEILTPIKTSTTTPPPLPPPIPVESFE